MNPEYTTVTTQEASRVATDLGISGRPEALMEFVLWSQRRVLAAQNVDENKEKEHG